MTVVRKASSETVDCSWFAGAKHERSNFHIDSLEVPKEEKK